MTAQPDVQLRRNIVSIVSVNLPLCPSSNKAFVSRSGSHLLMKTAICRFWEKLVREEHKQGADLPTLGSVAYGLWVDLPANMRGDIDNRVKLLSDALQTGNESLRTDSYYLGVVANDKNMAALHVERLAGLPADRCVATVVRLSQWSSYVSMRLC